MAKFVFVVGGVYSGTGKGIATASIALLLKLRNLRVEILKLDPYLNINAGIIRPTDHGEVYVCNDGSEVDLDLGSYERIAGVETSARNISTSGTLHKQLIEAQEAGKYLGQTVQLIPHMTNLIQQKLSNIATDADVVFVEIGGTVGDSESFAFYEAIRQFKQKLGDDVMVAMVAPILWVQTIKEFKSKPLQNAVKELQRHGLQVDILLCRPDRPVPENVLAKISNLTNVHRDSIFDCPDVSTVYEVPIEFYNRHLDDFIVDKFRLKRNACRIHKYRDLIDKSKNVTQIVNVVVFGKYDNCEEAYLSLKEAVFHAALANDVKAKIQWINAESIESDPSILNELSIDAAIVPGGFDSRGVEGKITAIKYVRENKIPFLGICLGLQCAVIEYARNVCGITNATSLEFDKNAEHPVIHFVKGQENLIKKSATMRLGSYDCELTKNSLAINSYNKKTISERHRHRYEVNPEYISILKDNGLNVSGVNPESGLIEIMEIDQKKHPFFIGTQAHPEFKSKLVDPAPLFKSLINAAKGNNE